MRLKEKWNDHSGMTLVEMILVLGIMAVLTSIAMPSMFGYIDKTKQRKYVMEAREVKQSLELYLMEKRATGGIDMMEFLEEISAQDLNAPGCPVVKYMNMECSDGAYIQNLTLEEGGVYIKQMIYVVDGYQIDVRQGKYSVTSLKSKKRGK